MPKHLECFSDVEFTEAIVVPSDAKKFFYLCRFITLGFDF
jgi:hypothetical protein